MMDAQAEKYVSDIRRLKEALSAIGVSAHILGHIADKLESQARVISEYRSTEPYIQGLKDGYETAFSTGLTGEKE